MVNPFAGCATHSTLLNELRQQEGTQCVAAKEGKVSVSILPGTNSPILEGWMEVWLGSPNQVPGVRCTRQKAYSPTALHTPSTTYSCYQSMQRKNLRSQFIKFQAEISHYSQRIEKHSNRTYVLVSDLIYSICFVYYFWRAPCAIK